MTRQQKIKALQAIRIGKSDAVGLLGYRWEFWQGCSTKPGIFENEATKEHLTASQLAKREQRNPRLKIWQTVKTYHDTPTKN